MNGSDSIASFYETVARSFNYKSGTFKVKFHSLPMSFVFPWMVSCHIQLVMRDTQKRLDLTSLDPIGGLGLSSLTNFFSIEHDNDEVVMNDADVEQV